MYFPLEQYLEKTAGISVRGATCPIPGNCCSDSHHEQHEGDGSAKQGWRPAGHPLSGGLKVAGYAESSVLDSGKVLGW